MAQLDHQVYIAMHVWQRLGLNHATWLHALRIAHPYPLMPYEIAEFEESSLTLENDLRAQTGSDQNSGRPAIRGQQVSYEVLI